MLQKRKEKNCSLDRSFSGWWCAHAVVCARRTLPALYNSTPLRRLAAGVTASCLLCACCHTRGRFDHLNTFVPCGGRQASSGRKFERLAQLGETRSIHRCQAVQMSPGCWRKLAKLLHRPLQVFAMTAVFQRLRIA